MVPILWILVICQVPSPSGVRGLLPPIMLFELVKELEGLASVVLGQLLLSSAGECGAPADAATGESVVNASVNIDCNSSQPAFLLYCINIRCLLANLAELCHQVKEMSPHFVLSQESWLNKSIEGVSLLNYRVISRRDRSEGENRGGVITYARLDVLNIVCVKESLDAERVWHYLHLDVGAVAICNWYRPGAGGEEQIASLAEDLVEIRDDVIGIIIMGDCNVHHRKWLRHSNANSSEGDLLHRIRDDLGLKQCVKSPTRGDYLLDLVLCDMEHCKAEVVAPIADHCGIVAKVSLPCPRDFRVTREVWHFKGAAWTNLKCALRECDWNRLSHGSVDSAVNYFLDLLITKCEEFIPHNKLSLLKATHPWLDAACESAIRQKNNAMGTADFASAQAQCAECLSDKHKRMFSAQH